MGGLRKYMPVTWVTSLVGSLALIGTPLFSGFYSKDSIIEAVSLSHIGGSGFAYFAVMAGVFVTAFYSFRMYFLVFHGDERFGQHQHQAQQAGTDHIAHGAHGHESVEGSHAAADAHHVASEHHGLSPGEKPHETPWVVTLPLVLLAIPSVVIGYLGIEPMLYGDFFQSAIFVDNEAHPVMHELAHHFHGPITMASHALTSAVFWLALSGVALAWFFYLKRPDIPATLKSRFGALYRLLEQKYYFDSFNEIFFAGGARLLGKALWKGGDAGLIDGLIVNGSTRIVSWFATFARLFQSGHIYHYAFTMIIGVFFLMTLWVWRA